MVENSSVGLVMLGSEVAVNVTGENRHQAVLARYRPGATVAVELGWCPVRTGRHKGQQAIEVLLDGQRVGELTYLMSQRYGAAVSGVIARGGRPGCTAQLHAGANGTEIKLRLPKDPDAIPNWGEPPTAVILPAVAPAQRKRPRARPWWIAAAVFALIMFMVVVGGGEDEAPPAADDAAATATPTTTEPITTTTTPAPPTTTTTKPPPPPPPPPPAKPKPKPEPTTEAPAPPPPPPAPKPDCDPNYSGCVPVASDVDCAGGSGNGPEYVVGPVQVIGKDIYGLDRDGDGTACDS